MQGILMHTNYLDKFVATENFTYITVTCQQRHPKEITAVFMWKKNEASYIWKGLSNQVILIYIFTCALV